MGKIIIAGAVCAATSLCATVPSIAAEKTYECHAVQNEASLVGPDRLIVSTASDTGKKFCRFFVSLPPPSSSRSSASVWFNALASNAQPKTLLDSVVDLTIAPIPKDDLRYKEVALRILKNSGFVENCIAFLFKKGAFSGKSEDRSVSCSVPPSAAELLLTVSVGDTFTSALTLPRPS